jgi:hypothetical protein
MDAKDRDKLSGLPLATDGRKAIEIRWLHGSRGAPGVLCATPENHVFR